MKIQIKPKYIPLTQQKFCCFPCCIQWVLLRRGIKVMNQEHIAKELGLIIPPEDERLFNLKMKVVKKLPKGKGGYGIWSYKLPEFLKNNKLPLKVKRFFPSKIENVADFISNNLKDGNDLIITINMAAYANPQSGVNYVHSMVIDSIRAEKKKVILTLGDPSYTHRKFFDIDLDVLLKGMSELYGNEKSFKVIYDKLK